MFTQSKTEIDYREEPWVNQLLVGIMVPIVSGSIFLAELSMRVRAGPVFGSAQETVLLAVPPIVAAILTWYVISKTSYLDDITITTGGLTFRHRDGARHYPWSRLGEPEFVPCGRGSGYYRMAIQGEEKPLRVNLPPFGIYRTEFEKVIAAARQGTLPDVAALHAAALIEDRRKTRIIGLFVIGLVVAQIVLVGVMHVTHR